ncbi:MAG: MarR family transcriptional regulator [Clostridiales bacterium]|nr:MarR family transcriptional regulator [Clostridiales bacterium]
MIDATTQNLQILTNFKFIQHAFKKRIHGHFKDLELTAPQGMLMFTVHSKGSMKISEISKIMGLSNSTVSGIVDRLEAQGYVNRIRSEEDRRVVNVHVTDEMSKKLMSHEDMYENLMQDALKNATKDEMNQIELGLQILSDLLRREQEEKKDV